MISARKFAKSVLFHARSARVRALAAPRKIGWLRRGLNLPRNEIFDPLADSEPGVRVTRLDRPATFRRPLPRIPDAEARALAFFAARAVERTGPSYVAELADGLAWGHASGGIFTARGRFVAALTHDPCGADLHVVWTKLRLPNPRRLSGRVLYLVTPEAADNFHHWMIDLLPRLGLVRRAGYRLADFTHVIVNHSSRGYQLATLAHLGIAPEKLIAADPSLFVRAESLVVPSLKLNDQTLPAEDAVFLRTAFLGANGAAVQPHRRVYLSRGDAAFRRLRNEAELLPLLRARGFEIVSPGELPSREQARLFAEAAVIAGPAGAAFANLVFATPGARVVEIAPPGWLAAFHWMISARLGLDHTILLGEGPVMRGVPDASARERDITIDPAKVCAFLDSPSFLATAPLS
jgi:capsular polysaccharide biosynthesis protein